MPTYQLSHRLFWGFRADVDTTVIADAVAEIKRRLRVQLLELGLEVLAEELDRAQFHTHPPTPHSDGIVYLCETNYHHGAGSTLTHAHTSSSALDGGATCPCSGGHDT